MNLFAKVALVNATVAGLYYASTIVSMWNEINASLAPVFGG